LGLIGDAEFRIATAALSALGVAEIALEVDFRLAWPWHGGQ
jgi:hypothetical protein